MQLHTGHPFWPINDGLPSVYPTLSTSITCEFVVLGGGITGALLAHRLVSEGHDVVVLDTREVASGSTSATTALLQYELDIPAHQVAKRLGDPLAIELHGATRRAVHDLIQLANSLPDSAQMHARPSLKLASVRRDVRDLHADYTFRRKHGFDVEWLSADDLATLYGMARPAGVRSADNAECDPYRLTHALLQDAVQKGARVFDRVPVRDVMLGKEWGEHVIITTEVGHAVRARSVVAATGYESTQWLPKRPAVLRNTYVMISEPLPPAWSDGPWPERALVWETARPYLYMRTTDDRRIIVGGEDDRFRTALTRDKRVQKKAERLAERLTELLPHLAVDPAYAWAGTFGETADALPRIGPVDGRPNLFVAACYGGNGITFSMIAAELLLARIEGVAHPLAECMRCDR